MPKTYITTQGDTWDSIAFKFYKNEKLMHRLIESNPKCLDIVIFPANITLVIPKVLETKNNSSTLIWR